MVTIFTKKKKKTQVVLFSKDLVYTTLSRYKIKHIISKIVILNILLCNVKLLIPLLSFDTYTQLNNPNILNQSCNWCFKSICC